VEELTIISRARQLLADTPWTIPLDVYGLVASRGFEVKESDQLPPGQAGGLVYKPGRKIIVVNANDHPYRRRFTVLHELAHDYLPLPSAHGAVLLADGLERVRGRPKEERLCDVFAAECLVPWQAIQPLAGQRAFNAATISELSDLFEASKQCVASRFAQCSPELAAYVLAEDGIVRNAIPSKALREARVFIRVGVALPADSAAAQLIRDHAHVAATDCDASDWSDSDAAIDFACTEEALNPGLTGQTISLLSFERVGHAGASAEATGDEEDVLLPELTGYMSWPKK
jgi:hypothetical protein